MTAMQVCGTGVLFLMLAMWVVASTVVVNRGVRAQQRMIEKLIPKVGENK